MGKTNVLAYRCLLLLLVVCLFVTGAGTVGCKLLRRGSDHNTLPPLFFNKMCIRDRVKICLDKLRFEVYYILTNYP